MSLRGYVLVETEIGRAQGVGRALRELRSELARVRSVDVVTGPFDVIVELEADDLQRLGRCITEEIQNTGGVHRTTTCLAVSLG